MNTKEIFKDAPRYIVARFNSISDFTWRSVFPDNSLTERLRMFQGKAKRAEELSRIKDILSEASLVVFVYLLRRFLNEGTKAAVQAVDTLKEIGIPALQIGSKTFADRNENVMMGERLADTMMACITDQNLIQLIDDAHYTGDIVSYYKKLIYV